MSCHLIKDVEATLHCICCLAEVVLAKEDVALSRLFDPELLARIPTGANGPLQLNRTLIRLIGAAHRGPVIVD
jgi:hypothetical protein